MMLNLIKKYGILLVGLLGNITFSYSQQLSHQVIVPLAGIASTSVISYSQTAGETAVEIEGCTYFVLTQGFQQPRCLKINENQKPGTGVNVYPNPADDFITIEMFGESARTFRIDFINITGMVVQSERMVFNGKFWYKDPMDIHSLMKGFYLVRVYSEDGLVNRNFKIEKL
jgi:hypothetical protein